VLYGNYRNHLLHECKSCTYEKVIYPGDLEAKEASKKAKTGYHYRREQEKIEAAKKLEYGILNRLFLEEGEELQKEMKEEKKEKVLSVPNGQWDIRMHGHQEVIQIKNRDDRNNRIRHHHREFDSDDDY